MASDQYAGLSVALTIASIGLAVGYWIWDYEKEQAKKRRREERLAKAIADTDALHSMPSHPAAPTPLPPLSIVPRAKVPPAQAVQVAPPTVAVIKQVQHWLNVLSGAKPGTQQFLSEDGSADERLSAALKKFQSTNGMTPTGKIDGMTQSLLEQRARHGASGVIVFGFRLFWQPQLDTLPSNAHTGEWMIEDSMHFVTAVPGYTQRIKPPNEHVVTDTLIKHYGLSSVVAKAIKDKQFSWSCPDCASQHAAQGHWWSAA